MNFKELESCIESVGKTPNQYLSYLSASGQGIYGLEPLTHYEVLQRGVSKYIEGKSEKERMDIIEELLRTEGEPNVEYKSEYDKYFSISWQSIHSPYEHGRFVQLPIELKPGNLQETILKKTRLVRFVKSIPYTHLWEDTKIYNGINIESYHPLTNSQRRFILDYIELYHIPPDRIYIDDWSEEQSIKRQLGLQFF